MFCWLFANTKLTDITPDKHQSSVCQLFIQGRMKVEKIDNNHFKQVYTICILVIPKVRSYVYALLDVSM